MGGILALYGTGFGWVGLRLWRDGRRAHRSVSTAPPHASHRLLALGGLGVVGHGALGLGTGLYFAYSGRVWCRFACPLAALMNIYARFSRFRIVTDGKKCISCNACTTTCHQGIDVMHPASRGEPVADPQCVRARPASRCAPPVPSRSDRSIELAR